jgi:hypothetical protein
MAKLIGSELAWRHNGKLLSCSSIDIEQRETYDSKMGENEMDLVSACCGPDPKSVNIPDSLGPW